MSTDLAVRVDSLIQESEQQFGATVAQYKWPILPANQLQAAKAALTKSEYLMKIATGDPEAVHDALIKAAVLGLDLTEGKRQGWLVPRKINRSNPGDKEKKKTVITLQTGYKGVEAIHQRMKVIDRVSIRVVYEGDSFEWSGDDAEKPKHDADWFGDRGGYKGAFAVTYFPDKSIQVCVASIKEIYEKHRDVSDSWKSYVAAQKEGKKSFPPVWLTHEKAMIEKTMVFIASKQWPASNRNDEVASHILETLHQVDTADYSIYRNRYTPQQKEQYDNLIENNDGLGLFLLERSIDSQLQSDLFNSFPKGQKTAMKDKVRSLSSQGAELLAELKSALTAEDYGKFAETMDGCVDLTISLTRREIDNKELFEEYLSQLKESANE